MQGSRRSLAIQMAWVIISAFSARNSLGLTHKKIRHIIAMDKKRSLKHHPLLTFIGSMNLAIVLLVMLAIASVIGTILKQNEAYASYVIKFGPFWFDVFRTLELYDVYSAIWFLTVLAFLLLSISACVWRNWAHFVKDMFSYQEHTHATQLQKMTLSVSGQHKTSSAELSPLAVQAIKQQGFKVKVTNQGSNQLIAAKKGAGHRLGYFFTHIAIVIICLGALLDSNIKFKVQEWMGMVEAETRSIALTDVNPKANIAVDNNSFRGSVNIPEGKSADVVFLTFKEGYLVQKLPFTVQVVDFRVDFYDTGMPKSFESDIILNAPELAEPIKTTIYVNKPLYYKDYAIYQSSFGDGGSQVEVRAWPMVSNNANPSQLTGEINRVISMNTPIGDFKLELNDYKTNNVIDLPEPDENGRKVKNLGPSVQFKVRDNEGQAVEYENYLIAVERAGAWYQASKFRRSMAEDFQFLLLPLDEKQSLNRFMNFLALLNDRHAMDAILNPSIEQEQDATKREQLETQKRFMQQLVNLFRIRGFDGIRGYLEQAVPEADKREAVFNQYLEIMTVAMQGLYLKTLEKEGNQGDTTEAQRRFFADSIEAINTLTNYGPPMFFEVTSVNHREASGLQITKSPGKDVVYFGSLLLVIGTFLLFYVRPQRLWLLLAPQNDGSTDYIFAGKDGKDDKMLQPVFNHLTQQLQQTLGEKP
jgi:cytochrome c biogenesis protein